MAPRPNSGLDGHEEDIVGDSPLSEVYHHNDLNDTSSSGLEDLDKEEETYEQISIIVGLVVALLFALLILVLCALIFRRMRRRSTVLPDRQSLDVKKLSDDVELKPVKRRGSRPSPRLTEMPPASPGAIDLPDGFSQYAFIPPNKGMQLWRGRVRILARHAKRKILKKEIGIHTCALPRRYRAQLKRIYVY